MTKQPLGTTYTSSDAASPDLDWSQVRETIRMLHLAVGQVDLAMREGDESVNELTESFVSMNSDVNNISEVIDESEGEILSRDAKHSIRNRCTNVNLRMNSAIVAFQFYDKLSQRLNHVTHALDSLAKLVADQVRLYNPYEWKALQDQIKSRHSTDEEKAIFEILNNGGSIEEALEKCKQIQKDMQRINDNVFF